MRALISVYDKTGIVEFANTLIEMGWEIISSGGTASALSAARIAVLEVEYLASLLRGRPSKVSKIIDRDHVNSMIKNNREGYILFDSVTMLQKNYHQSSIQNYYQEYNEFIDRLNIASESEQSQEFILSQLGKLNNLIKENPTLVNTFKKQFAGTRYSR